ncbi:MAG: hypothetical protein ACLQJ0_11505 [Steroidobacteraceae bacterium]|jgi:hypothetical protein
MAASKIAFLVNVDIGMGALMLTEPCHIHRQDAVKASADLPK